MNKLTQRILLGGLGVAAALGLTYLFWPEGEASAQPHTVPDAGGDGFPDKASTTGTLVSTVGKLWVLVNELVNAAGVPTGAAANYGWPFKGPTFDGRAFEASVSSYTQRVIQGVGLAHNAYHTDYSQTIMLASQTCLWKGEVRRLSDLLVDPEASKLLSHQGPLRVTRQPGIPQLDPLPSDMVPAPPVTRQDVANLPSPVGTMTKADYHQAIVDREAIMLQWVREGRAEYQFVAIDLGDLMFSVFTDALKFGGVRLGATAALTQQIADLLDCSLLTPRMADIVYDSATVVIQPAPLGGGPDMASTPTMLKESDRIDAKIVAAT